VAQKKQWLVQATVFLWWCTDCGMEGTLKLVQGKPDWSSRTEQSHRLERDRLIALDEICY